MSPIPLNKNFILTDKMNILGFLSTIQRFRRGLCFGYATCLILLRAVKFSADLIFVGESQKDVDIVLSVVSSLFAFLKSNNIPEQDRDSILKQIENLLKLYLNDKTDEA